MLSRITATQLILDGPNNFPAALSMLTVSPWRKAKSGMLQSALANREKWGEEREREGEREKERWGWCVVQSFAHKHLTVWL